jgi:hypothetical protein
VLKPSFYKDTINYFLDKKTRLLAPGGKIWLQNIPDVTDHLFLVNSNLLEGGQAILVEDPMENPLIQARELVKDQLQGLNCTDYTKLTGLPTSVPFIVLQKKLLATDDNVNSTPPLNRVSQKRNNPSDIPTATPHPSSAKRARRPSCPVTRDCPSCPGPSSHYSSSSSAFTRSSSRTSSCGSSSSSSNTTPHVLIDLTCDCSESFKVKKPRSCSICIGSPSSSVGGKVGFTV